MNKFGEALLVFVMVTIIVIIILTIIGPAGVEWLKNIFGQFTNPFG